MSTGTLLDLCPEFMLQNNKCMSTHNDSCFHINPHKCMIPLNQIFQLCLCHRDDNKTSKFLMYLDCILDDPLDVLQKSSGLIFRSGSEPLPGSSQDGVKHFT